MGAILLFIFDGAFQAIPNFGVRAVERTESTELTTDAFEELAGRMSYLVTEGTVSFIASQRADYYNLTRFFMVEFITAVIISFLFSLLLHRLNVLSRNQRLSVAFGFAVVASLAIHLPYYNWWGFSLPYTLGVCAKTIFGWTLLAIVQNRFIH